MTDEKPMKKAKKRPTPFIESDGQLYIKAKYAGMHYLCLLFDGTQLVAFDKGKTLALHIDDAIRWHEKEIRDSKGSWADRTLALLRKAKADFDVGRVVSQ